MASVFAIGPRSGGVSHAFTGTVAALRRDGWDVHERRPLETGAAMARALRLLGRERRVFRGADVVHVEFGSNDRSTFWCALLAVLLRDDVVAVLHDPAKVAHSPGAGLIALEGRWRLRIAYRILSPLLDRPVVTLLLRRAGAFVVLGPQAQEDLLRRTGRPISRLRLGADPRPDRAQPPSAGTHVLFAGFLGPSKGVDVLVQAWEGIAEPSLPLVIAGGASANHQPWLENVRQQADGLPSPPRWLGPVADENEFQELFRQAAIVVMPYRDSAPASGIITRAMSEGCCIIATRVPAALDVIEPDDSGVLVDPDDPRALGDELSRLLADGDERDRLGAAAARRSRDVFGWDGVVRALEDVYAAAGGRD